MRAEYKEYKIIGKQSMCFRIKEISHRKPKKKKKVENAIQKTKEGSPNIPPMTFNLLFSVHNSQ